MPKPAKIKKKKSFMFTTKHHSFLSVLGAVIAVITFMTLASSTYICFYYRGKASINIGGACFFACLSNIIGVICGCLALNERDIHRWLPIVDAIVNGCMLVIWILYVIIGAHML